MPRYRIYVRENLDQNLQNEAVRLGIRPQDVLRMRLESVATQPAIAEVLNDLRRTRESVFGLIKLLEHLAPDIAYVGAVSRISTKQNEAYWQSAQAAERQILSLISAIKKTLDEPKSEASCGL